MAFLDGVQSITPYVTSVDVEATGNWDGA